MSRYFFSLATKNDSPGGTSGVSKTVWSLKMVSFAWRPCEQLVSSGEWSETLRPIILGGKSLQALNHYKHLKGKASKDRRYEDVVYSSCLQKTKYKTKVLNLYFAKLSFLGQKRFIYSDLIEKL